MILHIKSIQKISPHFNGRLKLELTPAYRAVFNLYVVEGFSHKEIGEKLDITESTSRSNLVKARLKLQEMLTSKYGHYNEK